MEKQNTNRIYLFEVEIKLIKQLLLKFHHNFYTFWLKHQQSKPELQHFTSIVM